MTNEELWQAVLGELELSISKPNFNTWLKETFISAFNENEQGIFIGVPNAFTQTWLQNKYHKAILSALQNITDNKVKKVVYRVETKKAFALGSRKITEQQETTLPDSLRRLLEEIGLNPRYAFENFIVGKGNELAHAAAQAVVDNLGQKYNPLFIHGGVGLGKTHLLQAVGQEVLKRDKNKNILYISAEGFANDFIQAIRTGRGKDFKNHYRSLDLLLIDDVQFIAGKESTREEFFHTFNTLHQKNSQLVFTADRPPRSISGLEDRLTSRLEMGMIADVSALDIETRIAILETKAKERDFQLMGETVQYLATNFQRNVRELEGALNKIIAHCELHNTECDLKLVKEVVSSLANQVKKGAVTARQLIKVVADFYELKLNDLTEGGRRRELAIPRQIAMYLLREELDCSYPTIGLELGGRDHTTAMHAYKKIFKEMEAEGRIKQEIEMIKERLYNYND